MLGMIRGVQAPFLKPDSFSLPWARSLLSGCCFFKFQETNKTPKFCPTCPNPLNFPFLQICLSTISSQLQPFNSRFLDTLLSLVVFTPIQLLVSVYFQAGLSFLSLLYELSIFVLIQFLSLAETSLWPENSKTSFVTSDTSLRTSELQSRGSSIQPRAMALPMQVNLWKIQLLILFKATVDCAE